MDGYRRIGCSICFGIIFLSKNLQKNGTKLYRRIAAAGWGVKKRPRKKVLSLQTFCDIISAFAGIICLNHYVRVGIFLTMCWETADEQLYHYAVLWLWYQNILM